MAENSIIIIDESSESESRHSLPLGSMDSIGSDTFSARHLDSSGACSPSGLSCAPPTFQSPMHGAGHPSSAGIKPLEGYQPPDGLSEEDERLGWRLDRLSLFSHLAVFSMLGVLIRYGLEILFGPEVSHVTDDSQTTFIDLPANTFGTFLMGLVGISFKPQLLRYSEHLAIGLATGLCGSITTFASWNQRMLAIATDGLWVRAISGYIVGSALPLVSLFVGMDVAHGLQWLLHRHQARRARRNLPPSLLLSPSPNSFHRRWLSLLLSLSAAILLWTLSLSAALWDNKSDKRQRLWIACSLAPLGVWIRWAAAVAWNPKPPGSVPLMSTEGDPEPEAGGMASLPAASASPVPVAVDRGQRFSPSSTSPGRCRGLLLWVPLGTLFANVLASALEAAVSVIYLVTGTPLSALLVGGFQLGFIGCLSTVSTLMAEVCAMHKDLRTRWRAYLYLFVLTIVSSFAIGVLLYSVPVWTHNYKSQYNHV